MMMMVRLGQPGPCSWLAEIRASCDWPKAAGCMKGPIASLSLDVISVDRRTSSPKSGLPATKCVYDRITKCAMQDFKYWLVVP